jgi:hypothetical protein
MNTTLNITNYNPNLENDKKYIDEFIKFMELIKTRLTTKKYHIFQSFITKLNKYVSIISQQLEKEVLEKNEEDDYFDNNDDIEDDNISIASISEYEADEEIYDCEEIQIEQFEDIMSINYSKCLNRFDFDFVRDCIYA